MTASLYPTTPLLQPVPTNIIPYINSSSSNLSINLVIARHRTQASLMLPFLTQSHMSWRMATWKMVAW